MPVFWEPQEPLADVGLSGLSQHTRVPGPAPRLKRFLLAGLAGGLQRNAIRIPGLRIHAGVAPALKFAIQTSVASTRQGSNRDHPGGEARAKRSWLSIPPAAVRVDDARFLHFEYRVGSDSTGTSEPCSNLSRSTLLWCTMMHQMALNRPGPFMSCLTDEGPL
jgi:hypothetical protein